MTKPLIQQRANQLVREMHSNDETADTFRKLEERRHRGSAKKQGYDRSLAECHTAKFSSNGGIQTGISSFFTSTKSDDKSRTAISMKDGNIKSVIETAEKRKDSPSALGDTIQPEKKLKLAPVFVVAAERTKEPGPTYSSEKDDALKTLLKEDGVIELASIPK